MALLGAVRAWIASLNTAAGTRKIQWATAPVKGLLSSPIPTEIARDIGSLLDPKLSLMEADLSRGRNGHPIGFLQVSCLFLPAP